MKLDGLLGKDWLALLGASGNRGDWVTGGEYLNWAKSGLAIWWLIVTNQWGVSDWSWSANLPTRPARLVAIDLATDVSRWCNWVVTAVYVVPRDCLPVSIIRELWVSPDAQTNKIII